MSDNSFVTLPDNQPPTSQPVVPQPRNTTTQPTPSTAPTSYPAPNTHPVPSNNLANFPQITQQQRPLPNIDVNRLFETFASMEAGTETVNPERAMRDMYGMMLHMFSQGTENERVKATVTQCVSRLDALEAKVGNSDEAAIPLSIAVRNMPLPSPGGSDLQLIQTAFREIRAQGVDVDRDIVKANRLGDTSNGRLGTILVEMKTQEAKSQIMKTKKCLENHPNEGLRKLIIKNAQTKSEIKTNIAMNEILKRIPGQENNFVAGNGQIMSKNPRPSLPHGLPHTQQRQQFYQAANYPHNYQSNHLTQYQISPAQNFRFNQPPPPPPITPVSQSFGFAVPPPTLNPAPGDLVSQELQPTENSLRLSPSEQNQQQSQSLLLNQNENNENPAVVNPTEQGTGTPA